MIVSSSDLASNIAPDPVSSNGEITSNPFAALELNPSLEGLIDFD
jgi:hypothetical protein